MAEPPVCAPIDANGNLTSDGTKTYLWNALNQLVEVKEGSTTIATFEYDGAGRRTEKGAAGVTHQYIYDAEDIVEERITGSSSDTVRYYHGAGTDEPLARKNSSDVVTYYLADHLGSIVQETNANGAVILEREYGPWGDLLSGASTAGHAFQGREWDSEISLFYFRARYYNAAAGAWTADDPIGFSGGPNLSQFVNNNPVRLVDPFGLCGGEQSQGRPDPSKVTNEERWLRVKQVLEVLDVLSKVSVVVVGILAENPGPAAEVVAAEVAVAQTTTFYRGVSNLEAADALAYGLRPGPNNSYQTGKMLAETAADAAKWGRAMNGEGNFQVLKIEVPKAIADELLPFGRIDGIGPAHFGTLEQLKNVTITLLGPK